MRVEQRFTLCVRVEQRFRLTALCFAFSSLFSRLATGRALAAPPWYGAAAAVPTPYSPYMQSVDQRFRFLDLHKFGVTRTIVAHVCPPFSEGYGGMDDEQVAHS